MDVHKADAQFFTQVMYGAAGFATLGLLLCVARSAWAYPVAWIVFILCAASLIAGLMIADSGYKIRRQDFRTSLELNLPAEGRADALHGRFDILA